jgi:poly(3-hydroxybutyrate) depolymerase
MLWCGNAILTPDDAALSHRVFYPRDRFECKDEASVIELTPTTTCHRHSECGASGTESVEYCLIEQLGHCWSGGDCCDSNCRDQSFNNPDASAQVIDFFKRIRAAQLRNSTLAGTV